MEDRNSPSTTAPAAEFCENWRDRLAVSGGGEEKMAAGRAETWLDSIINEASQAVTAAGLSIFLLLF